MYTQPAGADTLTVILDCVPESVPLTVALVREVTGKTGPALEYTLLGSASTLVVSLTRKSGMPSSVGTVTRTT